MRRHQRRAERDAAHRPQALGEPVGERHGLERAVAHVGAQRAALDRARPEQVVADVEPGPEPRGDRDVHPAGERDRSARGRDDLALGDDEELGVAHRDMALDALERAGAGAARHREQHQDRRRHPHPPLPYLAHVRRPPTPRG